jgi:YD repeat-containing protein
MGLSEATLSVAILSLISSVFSRGHRTSIQLPKGASVSRTYDWFTGHVRSETDKNGLTTAFDYSDPLNRLKQITRGSALGGTIAANTVVAYTDVPAAGATPVSVQVNKDQYGSGDQRLQTTTQFDAFGRDTISTVSGAATINTVTQYDGLGRVYQHCNPVNAAGPSTTDGCTTLTYDAAGRQTKVTDPDGSSASNVYSVLTSGSTTVRTTQTTDEAGVQKTLQYDGLGRLTGAVEAVDTAAYTYDALDDLMSVSQTDTSGTGSNLLVQQRSFTYDSLKRLKYSMNPETGPINYTYDANGNLVAKADGRFTTCYGNLSGTSCDGSGYDSLNRATHISFSDSNTPSVRICYDGYAYSANTGCAEQLRRRISGCGRRLRLRGWLRAGRLLMSRSRAIAMTRPEGLLAARRQRAERLIRSFIRITTTTNWLVFSTRRIEW